MKISAGLARFSLPMSARDGHSRKPNVQKPEIRLQINALSDNRYLLRFFGFASDFPSLSVCSMLSYRQPGARSACRSAAPARPAYNDRSAMSPPNEPRDAVRRNAQSHFTHTERRDELVRQEIEKERAAVDAKTGKPKALRPGQGGSAK